MQPIAIVTGASSGIGAATAKALAAAGYAVVVTYQRDQQGAQQVLSDIRKSGGQAAAFALDVAQEAEVAELFSFTDRRYGPLSLLVNNAGITGGTARLDQLSSERLQQVFAVNVLGSFYCAAQAVRRMSTRHGGQGGSIINISSRAAQLGSGGEWIHYAATKGAIDTMTTGLANEVAREGIRVNGVAPGLIDTPLHALAGLPERVQHMAPHIPLGRAGLPEEVAQCVCWLASPAAAYITGAIVPVSGGR
ncbi:SDR family oxidoreductase [Pseudomonas sp. 5P_3.1_Bac2]|uniref:SDR family oxidoreductase n=1 Tax=Pseudomonas sp. 5P_3.1_Bac2 TaxID=2971617 RepID=UPI0021C72F34|nr:SDR family oxidoreductase [Pseudomonas sp. 5P_3.1_Bac2]MCU1717140.1 SDR family oxidoreductase [Pseudomonas sp. 5P_3.1_Bac2]